MRIVLTGVSGFLGRYFYRLAVERGHDVVSLGRRRLGLPGERQWDLQSPVPQGVFACDAVVHLAAAVDLSPALSAETYLVNILSALHLARWAGDSGFSMLFTSSIDIHRGVEVVGAASPVTLASNYSVSKYVAEQTMAELCPRACILRIGGIYGPGGPAHLGLNAAIGDALRDGTPPTLRGDGAGRRNYIWVQDMARWLLHLVENPSACRAGEPIYVAGPETLTIRQYLEAILEAYCPGRSLIEEAGSAGRDCVVQASTPPVVLTPFREVLERCRTGVLYA